MNTLYTATATATAGRGGKVSSDDGTLALDLSVPKGLGGPGGTGTNPEQLFAAGYSACFGGALGLVAGQKKITTGKVHITAKVSIGKTDAGGFGLAVTLLGDFPELADKAVAQELMEAAHQVCPYSNATRNNIEVKLEVAPLAGVPETVEGPRAGPSISGGRVATTGDRSASDPPRRLSRPPRRCLRGRRAMP